MLYRPSTVVARCCMVALMGLSAAAHAQRVEPGLWEISSQMKMPDNPELEKQMATIQEQMKKLPPEARKQLESSLNIGIVGNDPRKIHMCVSPEQAANAFSQPPEGDCNYKETGRSGNTITGQVSCPAAGSQGQFTTTIHSSTQYRTVAQFTSPQGRMDLNSEGRHISKDCGKLLPQPTR